MTLMLFMFALGSVEAGVHLWRYRSANRDGWALCGNTAGGLVVLERFGHARPA